MKPRHPKERRASSAAAEPPARRTRTAWHLAAACALFLAQAWHRYPIVASVPGGRFDDPDAMHHARRVTRAIADGAFLPPADDPWLAFPQGAREIWPPLHDASLALVARLGGSSRSAPARGMVLAGAVPLVEGILALLLAAWIAARASDVSAAAPAAWIFALTPILARRASYGEIDHNITEVLGALALFAVAERLTRPREARGTALSAALWAAAVLLAMGFFTGLVLSAGVAAAAFLVRDALDRERRGRGSAVLAAGFSLAAAALSVLAGIRVPPLPGDPWRLGPVYVLVLCAGGAVCGAAALFFARGRADRLTRVVAGAAILVAAAVAAMQPRASFPAAVKAFAFFGSRDPWLATIREFQPLVTQSLELSKAMPGLLAGGAALVLVVLAWRGPRERRPSVRVVALAVASGALVVLALAQGRFAGVAAGLAAAFAGAVWAGTADRRGRRILLVVSAAGVVWSGWFTLAMITATRHGSDAPPEDVSLGAQSARALRLMTGETPRPDGVLAPWGAGHHIVRLAGLPVVLTPFGSALPEFREGLSVYLEESPAKAVETLSRLRVRWVVVEAPPASILDAARPLGRDADAYFLGAGWDALSQRGARTFAARLYRHAPPEPGDTEADRDALARMQQRVDGSRPRQSAEGVALPRFLLFELR